MKNLTRQQEKAIFAQKNVKVSSKRLCKDCGKEIKGHPNKIRCAECQKVADAKNKQKHQDKRAKKGYMKGYRKTSKHYNLKQARQVGSRNPNKIPKGKVNVDGEYPDNPDRTYGKETDRESQNIRNQEDYDDAGEDRDFEYRNNRWQKVKCSKGQDTTEKSEYEQFYGVKDDTKNE